MVSNQESRHDMIASPAPQRDIKALDNDALSEIITKCEEAIADGSAEIEDYEAFVLCQKELARRTWS